MPSERRRAERAEHAGATQPEGGSISAVGAARVVGRRPAFGLRGGSQTGRGRDSPPKGSAHGHRLDLRSRTRGRLRRWPVSLPLGPEAVAGGTVTFLAGRSRPWCSSRSSNVGTLPEAPQTGEHRGRAGGTSMLLARSPTLGRATASHLSLRSRGWGATRPGRWSGLRRAMGDVSIRIAGAVRDLVDGQRSMTSTADRLLVPLGLVLSDISPRGGASVQVRAGRYGGGCQAKLTGASGKGDRGGWARRSDVGIESVGAGSSTRRSSGGSSMR